MKQPKNWSPIVQNRIIYNIFLFYGWVLFQYSNEKQVVEDFKKFASDFVTYQDFIVAMQQEIRKDTEIGRIWHHIPTFFFSFIWKQMKQTGEQLTDDQIAEAWDRYLEYLKFAYKIESTAKKQNKITEDTLTPQRIITNAKQKLQILKDTFEDFCDDDAIEYFCYLSEEYVKSLKSKMEN